MQLIADRVAISIGKLAYFGFGLNLSLSNRFGKYFGAAQKKRREPALSVDTLATLILLDCSCKFHSALLRPSNRIFLCRSGHQSRYPLSLHLKTVFFLYAGFLIAVANA
jgi:hypothetical protein